MKRPVSRRRIAALALMASAFPLAAAAAFAAQPAVAELAPQVQTTRLPGLPGATGSTAAYAVNRAGTVAGTATTPDGAQHAVKWVDGRIVDLDRGRAVRADVARGISDRGHVVGEDASLGYFHARPLLWRDGRRIVLPVPEPPPGDFLYGCFALTINNAGLIGGYCDVDINSSVNSMPVVWRNGAASVPWAWGRVTAINQAGHLAGRYEPDYNAEVLQAVLDTGGGYVVLPPLLADGRQDQAFAVNASDVVVGQSEGRPVRWRAGAVAALPTPSGTGSAFGINRWGTVAGVAGAAPRPVVWKYGRFTPLGPSRGAAVAINDRGDVAGWATAASGRTTAIRWHLSGSGS